MATYESFKLHLRRKVEATEYSFNESYYESVSDIFEDTPEDAKDLEIQKLKSENSNLKASVELIKLMMNSLEMTSAHKDDMIKEKDKIIKAYKNRLHDKPKSKEKQK